VTDDGDDDEDTAEDTFNRLIVYYVKSAYFLFIYISKFIFN